MNTSSAIGIYIYIYLVLISEPFPNVNALFHIYLVKQFLGVNQLIDLSWPPSSNTSRFKFKMT